MNDSSFYRGLLVELNKIANELPQPQPKKKSFIRSALPYGALGVGLGLAGLGAYKASKAPTPFTPTPIEKDPTDGLQTPSTTNPGSFMDVPGEVSPLTSDPKMVSPLATPESSESSSLLDNAVNTGSVASIAAPAAVGTGSLANWIAKNTVGKELPGSGTIKSLTSSPVTKAIGSAAGSALNAGYGFQELRDAYNNPDQNSNFIRGAQATGGVAQLGLSALPAIGPLARQVAPKLMGTALGLPMAVNGVVQGGLAAGNWAANENQKAMDVVADGLPRAYNNMNSQDPGEVAQARRWAEHMLNSDKGQEYINNVTEPSLLARIGYNPMSGAFGGNPSTPTTTIQHGMELLRKRLQQKQNQSGPTPIQVPNADSFGTGNNANNFSSWY